MGDPKTMGIYTTQGGWLAKHGWAPCDTDSKLVYSLPRWMADQTWVGHPVILT